MTEPQIIQIIIGLILLIFGRNLFWIFVSAIGFVYGFHIAVTYLHLESPLLVIGVGLGAGLIGAVLALALQKIAIALSGFFAGGYIALSLAQASMANSETGLIILFALGGVIGLILMLLLFQWALIFLSALMGSVLILESLNIVPETHLLSVALICIIGIFIQASTLARESTTSA